MTELYRWKWCLSDQRVSSCYLSQTTRFPSHCIRSVVKSQWTQETNHKASYSTLLSTLYYLENWSAQIATPRFGSQASWQTGRFLLLWRMSNSESSVSETIYKKNHVVWTHDTETKTLPDKSNFCEVIYMCIYFEYIYFIISEFGVSPGWKRSHSPLVCHNMWL